MRLILAYPPVRHRGWAGAVLPCWRFFLTARHRARSRCPVPG